MLSETLSNFVKLNHGKYSKYQLFSLKFDLAHVVILFFKYKLIKNSPSVIQVDQDALGTPSATSSSSTMASTAITCYVIRHHLDPPGITLNRFVCILGYQHVPCQYLVNAIDTCCTPHG